MTSHQIQDQATKHFFRTFSRHTLRIYAICVHNDGWCRSFIQICSFTKRCSSFSVQFFFSLFVPVFPLSVPKLVIMRVHYHNISFYKPTVHKFRKMYSLTLVILGSPSERTFFSVQQKEKSYFGDSHRVGGLILTVKTRLWRNI